MSEDTLKSTLVEELDKCGYQYKIITTDHIDDLQSEIENQFTTNARENSPNGYRLRGNYCLVGCLYCQKACPVNKDVVKSVKEGPVFSEKETAFIFQGHAQNMGSQHALQKLESLDIVRYLPVMGRNLRVLQEQFWM